MLHSMATIMEVTVVEKCLAKIAGTNYSALFSYGKLTALWQFPPTSL